MLEHDRSDAANTENKNASRSYTLARGNRIDTHVFKIADKSRAGPINVRRYDRDKQIKSFKLREQVGAERLGQDGGEVGKLTS